jgi:tRNA-(ms[2]io[6]A)-hydroxylase
MPRRLPVIQSSAERDGPVRPPSHWIGIAAAATLALWMPLSLVAFTAGRALAARIAGVGDVSELDPSGVGLSATTRAGMTAALAVPVLLSLALSALGAGALVGRFGERAGAREAVLGATLGAWVPCGAAVLGGGLRPFAVAAVTSVLVAAVAGLSAAAGSRLGRGGGRSK